MKVWFLVVIFVFSCDGAKILGVFNHPGMSHTNLGKVLLTNLAKKGHEVVMISAFPLEEAIENYRDVHLANHLEDLKRRNKMNVNKAMGLSDLINMTLQHTEDTFTDPQVRTLLNSNESFDVIIIDWFYNEATLMFAHIYNAPVIYISSFGNMALLNELTGNVLPYSYVPGAGLYMSDEMSFTHRLIMTLLNVGFNGIYVYRRNNAHFEILKRHFNNAPSIPELQEKVALVLSNSHFSFETPRPFTPNIIPVGGFHVPEPKVLPKAIKDFLDGASDGAIFFSLGSQIKSSNFNETVVAGILKALGTIKQRVLWKYELDDLSGVPKNVKVMKWLPQVDILAHPNLKLFITHGGVLSLIEAFHYNVPLICLPFNGDQLTNAAFIESRGVGVTIFPETVNEKILIGAIKEMMSNSKYQENMNYRSSLLREQLVKPLDTAIYWVEHVIKYGHGEHLKPFSTKLAWYKYYLIDVIGLFLSLIFVFVAVGYYGIKISLRAISKVVSVMRKVKIE